MPSVFDCPLASAAAMLSCCSMIAAPMAAKVMTIAMICRWREPRSSASASPPPTPSSSPVLAASTGAGALVPAHDADDDEQARRRGSPRSRAASSSVPSDSTSVRGDGRAGGAAQAGAAADEPEQPLGLPRVVDVVGQRPELADEQDAEDQAEEVEPDRDPLGSDLGEEHPEGHAAGRSSRPGSPGSPTAAARRRSPWCSPASARRSACRRRTAPTAGCRRPGCVMNCDRVTGLTML